MIYTTCFSNLKNLPKDIIPIAICNKVPRSYKGLKNTRLAPEGGFINTYLMERDNEFYKEKYYECVLNKRDAHQEVDRMLSKIKNTKGTNFNIALVCWEKPDKHCHRHYVAEWLREAGYDVMEFKGTRKCKICKNLKYIYTDDEGDHYYECKKCGAVL